MENIHAYIKWLTIFTYRSTCNISICLSSTITFSSDKSICSIDWLHVHRLPNRTSFCIVFCQSLKNLSWTTLSVLRNVKCLTLSSYLLAHCLWINNHAGQPVIQFTVFKVHRIHLNRKSLESFFISFKDFFLLCNMFF